MGFTIERVSTPLHLQLWAAIAVRCWPWQVQQVRHLLTRLDITEIRIQRGIKVEHYNYSGPRRLLFTRRIVRGAA